jgi:hypothetical protein
MFTGWRSVFTAVRYIRVKVAPEMQTTRLMLKADGLPSRQGVTLWTARNVNEYIPRDLIRFISRCPIFTVSSNPHKKVPSVTWAMILRVWISLGFRILFASLQYCPVLDALGWSERRTITYMKFGSVMNSVLLLDLVLLLPSIIWLSAVFHFSYSLKKLRFKCVTFSYSVLIPVYLPLVGALDSVLCYKLEGRRFESRMRWIF